MPEYLAPGVYVEETSFRARSIEGVSTSTTGFVGPTRRGQQDSNPELITSFGDFQRIYGGLDNLDFGQATTDQERLNYVAHAVRAYFDNGGSRLYVSRVISATAVTATARIPDPANAGDDTKDAGKFEARFKGNAGNGQVFVTPVELEASQKVLDKSPLGSLMRGEVEETGGATAQVFFVKKSATSWIDKDNKELVFTSLPKKMKILTVVVSAADKDGNAKSYGELGLDALHPRSIHSALAEFPSRRVDALENPFHFKPTSTTLSAEALFKALTDGTKADPPTAKVFQLSGGTDGAVPSASEYEDALKVFENLEGISIVAAPGHSAYATSAADTRQKLITHVEKRRSYRIAVLDTAPGKSTSEVREIRGDVDSTYAAIYYPWVIIGNPLARPGDSNVPTEIAVPPSGFVCGIYARTDVSRGVFKAPANEVVRGALRFESEVNFAQQEVLNPLGINCLRSFPERGRRVWGARTATSDSEWKYVNIRRYFNYLERSIDVGTQFAVFEPNGPKLWTTIRDTIEDFLENEWRQGALLGTSPKEAFFVRCDRSTMDQNDLDNGRLVCLVGVAAVKPAEFVIFRIGQTTADSRS